MSKIKQIALLAKVIEIIEEVVLKIGELEFKGFASIVPYRLKQGVEYNVALGVTVLDDFNIVESVIKEKTIQATNNSFKYFIRGILRRGIVDAGLFLQDDIFEEYEYLIGKYVEFEVDRISVEFL